MSKLEPKQQPKHQNQQPKQGGEFFKITIYFSAVIAIGLILLKIIQSFG